MQGVFIVVGDLDATTGVNKKMRGQMAALNESGLSVRPLFAKSKESKVRSILTRLPLLNLTIQWPDPRFASGIDFIYMRLPGYLSLSYLRFLSATKRLNPQIKIVMEIPTYPYGREFMLRARDIPLLIKDQICRRFLQGKVDRIAILTDEESVYGIPTLKIRNGYDFNGVGNIIRRPALDDSIDLCCAGIFMPWHGYDRLLQSLHQYRVEGGKRNIRIHFVGDGKSLPDYKALADKLGISRNVVFHGLMTQSAAFEVYQECDVGVDALRCFEKDIYYSCSLKTREYVAAGLPIVAACELDLESYPEFRDFIYRVPNSNDEISMSGVIKFYDSLKARYEGGNQLAVHINSAARKYLSYVSAMRNVCEYLWS